VTSVQNVRAGQPTPVTAPGRIASGRRVRAAQLLAGNPSLHQIATVAGLGYSHLLAVTKGAEPLTSTDCRDLGAALNVPAEWLAHGWDVSGEASR
jgi:hypothetical protein